MKKTLSLILLIVTLAAVLTCAVSARYIEPGNEFDDGDYYIYTARDIIDSAISNPAAVKSSVLEYSYEKDKMNLGDDIVRFSLKPGDKYPITMDFTLPENVTASDYPYMVFEYTNTIDYNNEAKVWATSFELCKTSDEKYGRFFIQGTNRSELVVDADYHKSSVISVTAVNDYGDVAADSYIKSVRLFPYSGTPDWNDSRPVFDTAGEFKIKYIAFFGDQIQAENFVYEKSNYVPTIGATHRAFMFPSSNIDTEFRPDDGFTYIEALAAIANNAVDLSGVEDKPNAYGIEKNDKKYGKYYTALGYLTQQSIITSEDGFKSSLDDDITAEDLNALLGLNSGDPDYDGNGTVTRAEAAKYLCVAFGRTPDVNSFDGIYISYFSDVPMKKVVAAQGNGDYNTTATPYEYYAYIMEAAYTHGVDQASGNTEKWVYADDPYLHATKATASTIKDLENQFKLGRERVLGTLSEYEKDPEAFKAKIAEKGNNIYYISNNGTAGANGLSKDTPNIHYTYIKDTVRSGDVVLFERGGEWHTDAVGDKFNFKSGVTYSCYGAESDATQGYTDLPKPKLYGSVNAGNSGDWVEVVLSGTDYASYQGKIWKYNTELKINQDVGNIVFFQKDEPVSQAKKATSAPEGIFAPEEAIEVYGQRIIKNIADNTILSAGLDKVVGNGVTTWILDHENIVFKAEGDIGARFADVIDQIITDNEDDPNADPDLIYFHNIKMEAKTEGSYTYVDSPDNHAENYRVTGYADGDNYLYVYSANGNPGTLYDVELCTYGNAVRPSGNDVTIDNIAVVCTGAHGIGGSNNTNLVVTNCEVGWIGGSIQGINSKDGNWEFTRYGNSVEIFGKSNGYEISNCYMYQAFDCGPTVQWQGTPGSTSSVSNRVVEENVLIKDNVLWDADLEVWLTSKAANTFDTDPGSEETAEGGRYAALRNCVLDSNLVTGSGYGFGGYNHQKAEYCAFYGGVETYAPYSDCYISNNKFWNLRYHLLKAAPTSTADGRGFHWVNNTIVQTYDDAANKHYLGKFANNLIFCTGYGKNDLPLSNEVLQTLFVAKSMDSNRYFYIVAEGEDDPAISFMPAQEEIKSALLHIIAFPYNSKAGMIESVDDGFLGAYYNKLKSSNDMTELTAVPAASHYTYWTRISHDDTARVFLGAGNTLSAYPLGSSVYYQPVFISESVTINVHNVTGEILDDTDGYTRVKTAYPVTNLTVKYWEPDAVTGEKLLTVVYKDGTSKTGDPSFAAGYNLEATDSNTAPKWTVKINTGKEFTISYKNSLSFNYMFPIKDDVKVTVYEKTANDSDLTTAPIINTMYAWEEAGYANFTASFEIPEGYERVSHGVLLAKSGELLEEVESIDGALCIPEDVIVGRVRDDNGREITPVYTISKSIPANQEDGVVWYGRAYVTYKKDGEYFTCISGDILSENNKKISVMTIVGSGTFGDREVYAPVIWDDEIVDG